MRKKVEEKKSEEKVSRRGFWKTAAATAGVTAATIGVPAFLKHASAAPIKWKIQTAWDAGTVGFVKFQEFCKRMGEVSEGKLVFEGFLPGGLWGTFRSE